MGPSEKYTQWQPHITIHNACVLNTATPVARRFSGVKLNSKHSFSGRRFLEPVLASHLAFSQLLILNYASSCSCYGTPFQHLWRIIKALHVGTLIQNSNAEVNNSYVTLIYPFNFFSLFFWCLSFGVCCMLEQQECANS